MKKSIVLSSGGLDSSVCTAYAVDRYGKDNVVTVSLIYGQKHLKEIFCAEEIAKYYEVKHVVQDISSSFEFSKNVSSLMQGSEIQIVDKCYADQIAESGSPNTEVPLRNGIFLTVAASIAMCIFPGEEVKVIYGAHADDAAGEAYPDCSVEFANIADLLIQKGTRDLVSLERPLINMTKAEVVELGLKLKVPFQHTWSCYHGDDEAEGFCGTCRDRIFAFKANGVIDPIKYSTPIDWSGCKKIDYLIDEYEEV